MKKDELVRKVCMECPICDKVHEVEERKRISQTIIKGEKVEYEERYFLCEYGDEDEKEFVTGKMLNCNLMNARNQYRISHGLLTSDEIVTIREQYGLSQVDLSKLLGWGEATISRYESKAIQDEAYDNVLRMIRTNSMIAYEYLEKNRDQFHLVKYSEIRNKIIQNINAHGKAYLKRQLLESEYVSYTEPSDVNGNRKLDIDKLERMISYYASTVDDLYKAQLMRMLWYADALMFKRHKQSMTGLVYRHASTGVLPIGHSYIVQLENVIVEIEESCENTRYHFLENKTINTKEFTEEEAKVLNCVLYKFKEYDVKQSEKYMWREKAYLETKMGEIIPFSLAETIELDNVMFK